MISTSDAREWIPPSGCAVVSRSSPESGAPCGPPRGCGPSSVRPAHHRLAPRNGRRSVRAEVSCEVRTEFRGSSTERTGRT